MRLFVAIDVPDDIKDAIERNVVDVLRPQLPGARWSRPEGRHLTLRFLGNVDEERADEISSTVTSVAKRHRGFDSSFDAIGGFPNVRRPRVLWVGIARGREEMAAIASDLETTFEALGFAPEGREPHPHFTLARFPAPKVIVSLPAVDVPTDAFRVEQIALFRSQLHPKGARYSVVSTAPLQ